jgi:hypothetical protein
MRLTATWMTLALGLSNCAPLEPAEVRGSAIVFGRVTGADGQPIAGALVNVMGDQAGNCPAGTARDYTAFVTTTDAQGAYRGHSSVPRQVTSGCVSVSASRGSGSPSVTVSGGPVRYKLGSPSIAADADSLRVDIVLSN